MSLPTADDLFRPTALPEEAAPQAPEHAADATGPGTTGEGAGEATGQDGAGTGAGTGAGAAAEEQGARRRAASGRVRHDEKMTVYITADELLELEHARLALRRQTGRAIDRGRLVRAAVAIALADLDAHGEDSQLVQRLKQT